VDALGEQVEHEELLHLKGSGEMRRWYTGRVENIECIMMRSGGAKKTVEDVPSFVFIEFWVIVQGSFHRMMESGWARSRPSGGRSRGRGDN
jgi:hypothetical protein